MTSARERKQPRSWDFLLTTMFILVLIVLTGIFMFGGFGLSVSTLGCADASQSCNERAITFAAQLATIGIPLVALAAIVVAIVFIAKRRVAFWVPAAGVVVVGIIYFVANFLVSEAVPT